MPKVMQVDLEICLSNLDFGIRFLLDLRDLFGVIFLIPSQNTEMTYLDDVQVI